MNRINFGTEVTWNSGSTSKEKTGTVIEFIPKGKSAAAIWEKHSIEGRFNPVDIMRYSEFDRYLIVVKRFGTNGRVLKPKYYAPIASVVERQNANKVPL